MSIYVCNDEQRCRNPQNTCPPTEGQNESPYAQRPFKEMRRVSPLLSVRDLKESLEFTLQRAAAKRLFPEVQDEWKHAVPPDPLARPRISLTFRELRGVLNAR